MSTADDLAKLDALRQQGVLSEAEFAAAKARLLGPLTRARCLYRQAYLPYGRPLIHGLRRFPRSTLQRNRCLAGANGLWAFSVWCWP